MLDKLAETGQTGRIDLRREPLGRRDYEDIREVLGTGEVSVRIDALGASLIRETGILGVWWVTHCNQADGVIAELIEITPVPEILKTHPDDLRAAHHRLRARLARFCPCPSDPSGGPDSRCMPIGGRP